MKAYISGPMRGKTLYNFQQFEDVSCWLKNAFGWEVTSAHDLAINSGEAIMSARYDCAGEYYTRNFQEVELNPADNKKAMVGIMTNMDAIVMLPKWQESSGACKELLVATLCGIKTLAVHPTENGFRMSTLVVDDKTLAMLLNALLTNRLVRQ